MVTLTPTLELDRLRASATWKVLTHSMASSMRAAAGTDAIALPWHCSLSCALQGGVMMVRNDGAWGISLEGAGIAGHSASLSGMAAAVQNTPHHLEKATAVQDCQCASACWP